MGHISVSRRSVAKGLAFAASGRAAAAPRDAHRDASLPTTSRVRDLLWRMSLEEKVQQLVGIAEDKSRVENAQGAFDPAAASAAFPLGFGHIASPSLSHVMRPGKDATRTAAECAAYMNALQHWALSSTRLGIPVLGHHEALHGLQARDATSFPAAIGLASTWDPALVERVYAAAAAEVRARGCHMVLNPVLDVARDPRWGRVEETYGEDPHLCATTGVAAVRGFQGSGGRLGPDQVFATVKHLAGHGVPENGSNTGPLMIGERTLREALLPPYEAAVRAGARSVMATYHEIDGVPMCANRHLLIDVLRGEWGFAGMVIADYKAISELMTIHHIAGSLEDAAATAFLAGVDVELPDPRAYVALPRLVRAGRVSAARLDEAVARVLAIKFDAGLFDQPLTNTALADARTGTAAHAALARQAALAVPVLLKNDGVLPLARDGHLAVIGHSAADTPIGGYSDVPRHVTSVIDSLRAEAGGALRVEYTEGVRATETRNWYNDDVRLPPTAEMARLRTAAVELASRATRVLLVLGDNEETAREAWNAQHKGDRASLDLVGEQQALAEAVLALGKPTIVLLLNGRPLSTPYLAEHANALIEGWYLGQETGPAIADLLFGRANPGGKLPISLPRSVGQLPVYYDRKPSARRGYLFDSTEPLYAFGHGLSYTSFALSAPRVPATARAGRDVIVEVDITNTGPRPGDEVVQVYLHQEVSSVTRPVRELKAFQRITLRPGEQRTVTLTLPGDAFALWNGAMRRVVEPGVFRVEAGPSLAALKSATLTVTA